MTDTTDIAALSYARLIEVRNILSGFEDGYDTVEDKENYEAMRDAQALINELISARWRLVTVTTKLEAERQRADANAQEIRRLEFQWEHRAPTQWAYDQACTALHAQRERAEVAEKERNTLKSAHGNMVTRCALLRQRTDLPVDRIPAYNSLVKAQEEIAALKGDQVPFAYAYHRDTGVWWLSLEKPKLPGYTEVRELFTAPKKPVVHPDTKRMDWLCAHVVQVREPLPYGSHAMFYGQCDSDDCEEYHSKLREQVDSAIEAAGCIVQTGDADKEDDHQSSAPAVLRDVLTAVSIGGSRTELIDALTAIKPNFGAPGSRDVDVRAAHAAIDKAIEKLSNL
ncbi:hypothetical protein FS594_08500 [Rahnella aquatilis]|nr:hypothetical protein FS594_08500 [Rahnella aquatilis]